MLKNLLLIASTVTMIAFLGLIVWSADDLFTRNRAAFYSEHGFIEHTQKIMMTIASYFLHMHR